MILTLNGLEVDNHITNDTSCLNCTSVRASVIGSSHKHRDWNLINARYVNKCSFTLAILPLGRPLLEPVCVGILLPMLLRLHSHRLAPVAADVVAGFLAKLVANLVMVTLPVRAVQVVDSN